MLMLLIAFLNTSPAKANCTDMMIGGESITVQKDGSLSASGLPLPTATADGRETAATFTKFPPPAVKPTSPEYNPDVGVKNIFVIERDMKKRPSAISTSHMYWNEKTNEEFKPRNPVPQTGYERMRFEFSHDKDGICSLERTIAGGQHVIYDKGLCARLSKSMDRLTDSEVAKCDSVLKEMSRTLESFKSELAREKNLSWNGQPLGANTYQAVLIDAANCQAAKDPLSSENPTLRKDNSKSEVGR